MNQTLAHDETDVGYWIALTRVKGIGPRRCIALVEALGSARAVWAAPLAKLAASGLNRGTVQAFTAARAQVTPETEVDSLQRIGAYAVTRTDPRYPILLAQIYDPPPVLYVRGTLDPPDCPAIAIVGTRRATPYGKMAAERLAGDLGRARVTVVSGLAYGIDAAAHRGALRAGGRTIAVLGSGLDHIYPTPHRSLAEEIVRSGALVTEFPVGTKPDAMNFPRRNRVISGLTSGTLVVEAPTKSGALITTDFAAEQGRDVMAVPGSIFSPTSEGANKLIKEGAAMIRTGDDILAELAPVLRYEQTAAADLLPLDSVERALLRFLSDEPTHIDDLAHEAALPMSVVSSKLTMMELNGLVHQVGGMNYVKGVF